MPDSLDSLDSLDALSAAPEHHELLLENEEIRVLRTVIKPGEKTAVHTHIWPCVSYVVSWSDMIRSDPEGNVLWDSRETPPRGERVAAFGAPLGPHTAHNIGDRNIEVIMTEFKQR